MANDSAIREPMIDAVLVKNANRMMTVASLLKHGIELNFADGAKGLIPYSDLPEIEERATLSTLELPNPYQMVLKANQGETVEILGHRPCEKSWFQIELTLGIRFPAAQSHKPRPSRTFQRRRKVGKPG